MLLIKRRRYEENKRNTLDWVLNGTSKVFMKINLTRIERVMNESFYPLLWDKKRYLILKGGAGSGKSCFSTEKILFRILYEKNHKVAVIRKVHRTHRDSTYAELCRTINRWGMGSLVKAIDGIPKIRFPAFNSEIIFLGTDDIEKLKSITGLTMIWIEELSELAERDFTQIDLRLRGFIKTYFQIIGSFNPVSDMSWIKGRFFDTEDEDATTHHSTYLGNRFLDEQYKKKIKDLERVDYQYYKIYGLGEWGSLGNLIYSNFKIKTFDYSEMSVRVLGIDFGYVNPSVCLLLAFQDNDVYICDEIYKTGLTNTKLMEKIDNKFGKTINSIADKSRPEYIAEFNSEGFYVFPSSGKLVLIGIDWLKRRTIFIHKENCPFTASEIKTYKWKEDKDGNVVEEPVKFKDHSMDAIRYASEWVSLDMSPEIGGRLV